MSKVYFTNLYVERAFLRCLAFFLGLCLLSNGNAQKQTKPPKLDLTYLQDRIRSWMGQKKQIDGPESVW